MMRRLLLISNSTLHGSDYLDHCKDQLKLFLSTEVKTVLFVPYALKDRAGYAELARKAFTALEVKTVLFVPYALKDRDGYAELARKAFTALGYGLDSIHDKPSAVEAVRSAEAIFIGNVLCSKITTDDVVIYGQNEDLCGGNTFRLLKTLYDEKVVTEIRRRVLEEGVPYIGSSAGTNVSTVGINTTNDMPIVYPPTFDGIGLVNFNINPHYLDPDPNSRHMGETRETRINQYHEYEDSPKVLGLREGCMLHVEGNTATLKGKTNARLFVRGQEPVEYEPGADLSFLLL